MENILLECNKFEQINLIRNMIINNMEYPKNILNNSMLIARTLSKDMFDNINNFDFNNHFFFGRLGNTEMRILYKHINDPCIRHNLVYPDKRAWLNAGIYPCTKQYLGIFSEYYYCAIKNASHFYAYWNNPLENYLIRDTNFIYNECVIKMDDWFLKLQNKKILIVSPFIDYMKLQWDNGNVFKCHNIIHDNIDIDIKYVKVPYALALNKPHNNWIETYNYLIEKINSSGEFDIALVSAGGYGMLLCNYIYMDLKKSAMYIGGELQCFFGIKGCRYDNKNIYNDYWISINECDKPKNYMMVENGCYW